MSQVIVSELLDRYIFELLVFSDTIMLEEEDVIERFAGGTV